MSKRPRVFTFSRPQRNAAGDIVRELFEEGKHLGEWYDESGGGDIGLVGAIYDWTQSGWLRNFSPERELALPNGSIIIVLNHFGRSHAVIYLLAAWPVLITGSLPDDGELHRFKELA